MLESKNINVLCFLHRVLDKRVSSRVVNSVICSEWVVFLGGVVDLYTVERRYFLLEIVASIVRDSKRLSVKVDSSGMFL